MFTHTIPLWMQRLFPSVTWRVNAGHPVVYLTFDDGPHPEITPWVLQQLEAYNAQATFFCVGDNVRKYPETYKSILKNGHRTGNHTYHHLNGWKTGLDTYLENIRKCAEWVDSDLFRPPYGKFTPAQLKRIRQDYRVVMWDLLTRDYDHQINTDRALGIVQQELRQGSVVVFHDSEKAYQNLRVMLPRFLSFCREKGFNFESL